MKLVLSTLSLSLLVSLVAGAQETEAIPCQEQILKSALLKRVEAAPVETLLSGSFEVLKVQASSENKDQYIVSTETKNRTDETTATVDYSVTVTDLENCQVQAKLYVD
jgi:hypothetical protein